MDEEDIRTYSIEQIRERVAKGGDRSDWARVDAMTDEDIERNMRDDPDWAEFIDIDWSKAVMVYPTSKKAVSIRLDDDIIDFFKETGKGYQTRINAVLRHFMNEQKCLKKGA